MSLSAFPHETSTCASITPAPSGSHGGAPSSSKHNGAVRLVQEAPGAHLPDGDQALGGSCSRPHGVAKEQDTDVNDDAVQVPGEGGRARGAPGVRQAHSRESRVAQSVRGLGIRVEAEGGPPGGLCGQKKHSRGTRGESARSPPGSTEAKCMNPGNELLASRALYNLRARLGWGG